IESSAARSSPPSPPRATPRTAPSRRRGTASSSTSSLGWTPSECVEAGAGGEGCRPPPPRYTLLLAGVVDLAEERPALPVEPRELLLLDRVEVRRTRVDFDSRQEQRQREILDVRRLPHDVLAREVVAALLEDVHQPLRDRIRVDIERVLRVAFGVVLLHERQPVPHALVILPLRVGRVLEIEGGDQVPGRLEPGG